MSYSRRVIFSHSRENDSIITVLFQDCKEYCYINMIYQNHIYGEKFMIQNYILLFFEYNPQEESPPGSSRTTTPRMPSVPNSLPIDITSFVSYDVTVPMGRGFSHADGWADAPPISLLSCQKRNGPCTVQREKRWRAPVQWPSARRSVQAPIWSGLWAFCDSCSCCPVADRADGAERPLHVLSFSFCCRWPGG